MQLQYAGHAVEPEEVSVYLNPGSRGKPFAVFSVSRMQVFLNTPEECDVLIKAAIEAKSLLLTAQHYSPEQMAEPESPVITDSERTCPEANPESGEHCHRGGDHGVHRDADGDEWRTDGAPLPLACGCTVPLGHLNIFRPGHPVECVLHGKTTVADTGDLSGVQDRHADLDPGELGSMADSDFYDITGRTA